VPGELEELRERVARLCSERDDLRQALAEQQEQLRVAFDHAPAAIALISITQGRFVYVNQGYSDFFGPTREELLAADPYELMLAATHPDDLDTDRQLFQRVADGEITGYELEKRYIAKGGETRWGLLSLASARDAAGHLSYVIVYITDIHERKLADEARARLEDRLRQSQKLEALGQLAGGVAHDFNNRLVVVLGYVELLRRELPAGSPLVEYAEQILEGAQRSAELTRQLLAFSRHQVLNPKSFDIHERLDGMRRMLQRLLGEHVELITVLGAKRAVYCDPGQLEQVIVNLAVNARDAMPGGGRLTFETRDVEQAPGAHAPDVRASDDLRPGDYVALSVADTGTGIARDVLPRIFEPFFSTKGVAGGTGLGLATVDGIVRQSGGAVAVATEVGRGTTFTVYLPAARAAREGTAAHREKVVASEGRPGQAETVLLCDDDAGTRRLMCDVLRMAGYRVLEARDGEHALAVAREHDGPVDLLLTDVVMPHLDGPHLARRLRAAHPALSVLFVSGWTQSDVAVDVAATDGDFLPKPFLPGDLLRSVRAVLDRRPPARTSATLPAFSEP
jgi:PAS domain S-box-containing protein